MIKLALRNLLARKRRTLLIALAVVVGVAQVTGAFILTDSMNKTVDKIFGEDSFDVAVVVTPKGNSDDFINPPTLAPQLVQRINGVEGVAAAQGDISAIVPMLKPNGDPLTVGPPSLVVMLTERGQTDLQVDSGRYAETDREVAIDAFTAERVGYKVGDRLSIVGEAGLEKPEIVGIVSYKDDTSLGGAALAIATEQAADRLGGRKGRYDSIQVDAEQGTSQPQLRNAIAAALQGERVTVRTGAEEAASQAADLKDQLGFLRPILLAFAAIALFVGSFVIVNTFSATLAQRSQELALLRALGATRGQVTRSVVMESLLIGVIAGVLGLLAGLAVAPGIIALFKGFGFDLPAQESAILPRTIIVALLIGPIVTTFAGLMPARRAVRVPPVQAMRGETVRSDTKRPGPLAFLVTALAVAAIVGSLLTSSTTAALLVAAGALLTLIAVALMAPIVLEPIMRVVGAPFARTGEIGSLARLNSMRSPRRTATTAGALMVGVALVTFVAVFAAGVSNLARGLFDERVTAQLALYQPSNQPYPGAAHQLIARDPDVQRVVGFAWGEFDRPGTDESVGVQGVDPGLGDVYKLNWVDGDDRLLDQLGPNDAISDREADNPVIADARVGDRIALERSDGSRFTLTVRGTVEEGTSLLGGALMFPVATMTAGGEPSKYWNSLVKVRDGADVGATQKRLQGQLDDRFPTLDALTKDEFAEKFVGQINQLVNMIYAFLAFALLVSLLGISTTFTLTVQERRRELGMMRAVGATRRQIRRLIRTEAILTGLLGAVLGTAIGLGFGALVARLLADDGFGYTVPVVTIVVIVVLAAIVAAVAAAIPARRASRVDVVEAVSAE